MYRIYSKYLCLCGLTPLKQIEDLTKLALLKIKETEKRKWIMRINLTIVFLVTILIQVTSASSLAQKITFRKSGCTIDLMFKEIKKQTNYNILWSSNIQLEAKEIINVDFKDAPLDQVMEFILQDKNLSYLIEDKTILIKSKSPLHKDNFISKLLEIDLNGVVVGVDGQPLPGATVKVKGSTKLFLTNAKGEFSIPAIPEKSVLIVTYTGYNPMEIAVNGRKKITITLSEDQKQLTEVAVIGYAEVQRKDLTGAVSSLQAKEFENTPVIRIDQMLQGKIAGADVTSMTGEPGTGTSIRIRGARSITADNEPLYVVDGVLDAGDLNSINPNDVASVDVLKDVSSTAIYGSRGANGVILITTKRGKSGKDIIKVSSNAGIAKLPKFLDVMNAQEWATMINENALLSNPVPPIPYPDVASLGEGTNWTEAVTRTAMFQNHTLSINGGTPSLKYYLSGNYSNQEGIIKASGYERYQFRLNLNKEFNKFFKAGATFNYASSMRLNNMINIGSNSGWSVSTLMLPPVINILNDDGGYEDWNPAWYAGGVINTPVAIVDMQKDYTKGSNLLSNFFTELEILPGLKLKNSFSYLKDESERNRYYPGSMPRRAFDKAGGYAYKASSPSSQILNENLLSYKHTWNENHNFDALAGFTYQRREFSNLAVSGNGYYIDAIEENSLQSAPSKLLTSITSGRSDQTIISYLARMNYNYKNKYYLTLTGRSDGSSNFSSNHKWAFFPSGAVKWQVSREDFMKDIKQINNLAFRASYGSSGNQAISPYQSLPQLAVNINGYIFDGSLPVAYYPGLLPNDNLTWETSRQINLGMDVSFLNNRINLTADVYKTNTKDLLLTIQMPQQTGYNTRLMNLGETENRGIELMLGTENLNYKDFKWLSTFTFAYNKQLVENLGPLVKVITHTNYTATQYPMYAYQVGLPTSTLFGAVYAGTWKSQQDIDENRDKYVSTATFYIPGRPRYIDQDGNGVLDQNDMIVLGQADPKYYGGFGNNFRYKGFELDIFLQYSQGNKMYNDTEFNMGTGTYLTNQYRYMLNRWHPTDNPTSDVPRVNSKDHVPNSRFVHDASFIRLKTLRVGYSFDPRDLNIKGFSNASIYASGVNLFLWTKYNGYDPEVNTKGSSSTVRRMDDGAYPNNRTLALNLSLTF